jgi:glucose/arabinose dehydrogenase
MNQCIARLFSAALFVALVLAAGLTATTARADDGLNLVPIAGPDGKIPFKSAGGKGPISIAYPPAATNGEQLFVLTQDGYIYVIDHGVLQPTPFLDIHTLTDTANENGLFSMVFAPDYATSRQFYINYSDESAGVGSKLNQHTVAGYRRSANNPNRADPTPTGTVLTVPTSGCMAMYSPHYGGQMAFGPDGHLWISVGDGGDGCSSAERALDLDDLHGKILRIDPTPSGGYTVPTDNPLVARAGSDHDVKPEIWAYGLRNPWRFSFDTAVPHDLWIADVGNTLVEELDRVSSDTTAGQIRFFGWPCAEGDTVTRTGSSCQTTPDLATGSSIVGATTVAPVYTFAHQGTSCSAIIGGVVLHDASLRAALANRYLFSSFCGGPYAGGELMSADAGAGSFTVRDEHLLAGYGVASISLDGCGHPYVVHVTGNGIWRLEGDTPGPCGEFLVPDTGLTAAEAPGTSAQFNYTSSVRGTTFACSLDGVDVTCSTDDLHQTTGTVTVGPVGPGIHTFAVAAVDEAGNRDATAATQSWTIPQPPTSPTTTVTTTAVVPPTTTTTTTPPDPIVEPPRPIMLRLLGLPSKVRADARGRLSVKLGVLPAGLSVAVVLRHGSDAVSRKLKVTGSGKALSLQLRLSAKWLKALRRQGALNLVVDIHVANGGARKRVKLHLLAPRRR